MNETVFIPGFTRGFGEARLKYIQKFGDKSQIPKLPFIHGLNKELLDKDTIIKAARLLGSDDSNFIHYWTLIQMISTIENGGICISKENLVQYLSNQFSSEEIQTYLSNDILKIQSIDFVHDDPVLIEDMDSIYFTNLYKIELDFCNRIHQLFIHNSITILPISDNSLNLEKFWAIQRCFQNTLSFICGGPGTGKTTVIKNIVQIAIQNGYDPSQIRLVAPTGKAAKRMEESCSEILQKYDTLEKPSTIHRLLGYSAGTGRFYFHSERNLPAEMIIVDEASMIDIFLANSLVNSIYLNEKTRLIFVGDPDQLLSVDTGSVFSDLVQLNKNISYLKEVFRQSPQGKDIVSLARSIQENLDVSLDRFQLSTDNILNGGIYFCPIENAKKSKKDSESLIRELILNWYKQASLDSNKIQILTFYNDGNLGVDKLNQYIQTNVQNHNHKSRYRFFPSDPIIVKVNMHDISIYNGEIGHYIEKDNQIFFQKLEGNQIQITPSLLDNFELAYTITVHKSQGSEYDHVCIVLPILEENFSSEFINKRLLYTAITRAKKSVTLIGNYEVFQYGIKNIGQIRQSQIINRLSLH